MSKSLNARCIRRWEVEFKGLCDSKVSPWWNKRDLRGYIRECALTTAECMVRAWPITTQCMIFLLKTAMTVAGLQNSQFGTTAAVVSSTGKKH